MTDMPSDPYVGRTNQLTTTFLDTLGVLLVAAGCGWAAWQVHPAWGLLAAGVVVTLLSAFAQWRDRPIPFRRLDDDASDVPLPGPTHPGNLHVIGR